MEATKSFPEAISLSKRAQAIIHNATCICKQCGCVHGDYEKDFCCHKHYMQWKIDNKYTEEEIKSNSLAAAIVKGDVEFSAGVEGVDFMVCKICQCKTRELSNHIKMHSLSPAEYKKRFNIACLKLEKRKMYGESNPAYQHGGKYSAWSENFVHGYDSERHDEFKKNHSLHQTANPSNQFSRAAYESDDDYSEAQTRDLKYFVDKYGEVEGKFKYSEKTRKWIESFPRLNYSLVSQKLFDGLMLRYSGDVYYATYDRADMSERQNKEYRMTCSNGRWVSLDFVDMNTKRVIEFDGDYWHGEARGNQKADADRDVMIENDGFTILHILERDFNTDPQKEIDKCINFLTQ